MKSIFFLFLLTSISAFHLHFFSYNTVIRRSLDDSIINFIKINNVNYMRMKENPKYLILKFFNDPIETAPNKEEIEKEKISINFNYPISVIDNNDKSINNVLTTFNSHNSRNSYYSFLNNNFNVDEDSNDYYANSNNENYDIYDLIRLNTKPLLILYEKKLYNHTMIYKHSYLIKNRTSYISKYALNYNNNFYKYAFDINATEVNKYETNWTVNAMFNVKNKQQINVTKNFIKDWVLFNINNNNKNYFYKKFLLFNYYENN